jgi:hypothetical protein
VTDVLSSFEGSQAASIAPVAIRPLRDILRFYFQDSNKYAGLVASPALCRLLEECTVELTATMIISPIDLRQAPFKKGPKTKTQRTKMQNVTHEYSARITVYGPRSERTSVSKILSEAGLCFQHPSAAECKQDVEYDNPHYLVRPGSQLPTLEGSSMPLDSLNTKNSDVLDEVTRSRLLRVFDTASDVDVSAQATASPRLRSTLKE